MASTTLATARDEFVNSSDGWAGAVQIVRGEPRGIAVGPHEHVWLSEEEQILTANAPRADDDNPFVNGTFTLLHKGSQIANRRPYGDQAGAQPTPVMPTESAPDLAETGAAPTPVGESLEGEHAAGEEVATPEAVPDGRRRRRA